MKSFDPNAEPSAWGTYEDAEALRRWSFERRTPGAGPPGLGLTDSDRYRGIVRFAARRIMSCSIFSRIRTDTMSRDRMRTSSSRCNRCNSHATGLRALVPQLSQGVEQGAGATRPGCGP